MRKLQKEVSVRAVKFLCGQGVEMRKFAKGSFRSCRKVFMRIRRRDAEILQKEVSVRAVKFLCGQSIEMRKLQKEVSVRAEKFLCG
jgi:hypothetical protein